MSGPCSCIHCTPAATEPAAPTRHQPVVLPDQPRMFRVHQHAGTQDCTLHPDGRMTLHIGAEVLTSMLTFDEMRERNWANAHIEWDPSPPTDEPPPEVAPENFPIALTFDDTQSDRSHLDHMENAS